MRRGAVVVAAVVAAGVVASWSPARSDEQPRTLTEFAVLGLADVTLRSRADVESGNVGATRGAVRLGRRVHVAGTILGDTIRLAHGDRLGPLFCRFVEGPGALGCATLTEPVANLSRLALVRVEPGAADVDVPRHAISAPLPPGSYGALTVARGSRLVLAGGGYDVLSLAVAPRGEVQCAGRCTVRVRQRVRFGRRSTLDVAAPLDASAVVIQLESRDPRPVFAAGPRATIAATVYAPEGDIVLGDHGRYQGAFVAQTVDVGRRADVRLLSGF